MIRNICPAITNISENILKIAGRQPPYYRTKEMQNIMANSKEMLLNLIQCDGRVIFLTASGTGAMDAVVANLIPQTANVLVINGGVFGKRWCDICDFYNINFKRFDIAEGQNINFERLKGVLDINKREMNPEYCIDTILMQATESSTGQRFDVKKVGELAKECGCFLIVDAIGAFAIDEYIMDKWNVDVSIISSQKGLSLMPGLSIVVLGEKALNKPLIHRQFYFSFDKYLKDYADLVFPFTPAISICLQLFQRLHDITKIGIKTIINQTELQAIDFRVKVGKLPVKFVTSDIKNQSNLNTTLEVNRSDVKTFFEYLQTKKIYVVPQRENRLNVGHIGDLTPQDNDILIGEIEKWLKRK